MRLLSAILSVYFVILSVLPCMDGTEGERQLTYEQIVEDHDHSGHDHPGAEDLCSPFCTCQCCSTPIIEVDKFTLNAVVTLLSTSPQLYSDQPLESFLSGLLQPPRV